MEVIATKAGVWGKLRAPGDVFEVPDKIKASWFEPTQKPTRSRNRRSSNTDELSDTDAESIDLVQALHGNEHDALSDAEESLNEAGE